MVKDRSELTVTNTNEQEGFVTIYIWSKTVPCNTLGTSHLKSSHVIHVELYSFFLGAIKFCWLILPSPFLLLRMLK